MRYDRSAVMRAAWVEWRYAQSKGWDKRDGVTFSECLRIAHRAHKQRQAEVSAYHACDRRRKATRDFIFVGAAA